MKIKTIIGFCKKIKSVWLINGINDTQWLGDGKALYPLWRMPQMTQENIYALMEIAEGKKNEYYYRGCEDAEVTIDFSDVADDESPVEDTNLMITVDGRTLKPLQTSKGIIFIDAKYLAPVMEYNDMLQLYERTNTNGFTLIAVKNGLVLIGLISPCNVVDENFVAELEILTQHCKVALFNKQKSEGDK